MNKQTLLLGALTLPLAYSASADDAVKKKPNVILIMTDDQGYGEIGRHGNDLIQTPNMDILHDESIRFTNYHTDPTSAPTRSALMTGRYSRRAGVIHTTMGRDNLRADEITMANVFNDNGYKTAMFGKWHLGTNYPLRPMDRGFQETVYFQGGSINQINDVWDNDRMNDSYLHNGVPQKYEGYCADVFFGEAMKYIGEHKDDPFFIYIPTSAGHMPFNTVKEWDDYYLERGLVKTHAQFFASLSRVDMNIGKLREYLKENDLDDNTIIIFTSDNGSTYPKYFNAGMKGQKGTVYEGGHRVPFFFRVPKDVKKTAPRSVNDLTSHIDVLPSLMELCGLNYNYDNKLDGRSFASLINDKKATLDDRILFLDQQRSHYPIKWRKFVMMTQKWRLVNKKELYDIITDPGQKTNVAVQHPEVVDSLLKAYEGFWDEFAERDDTCGFTRPILGSPYQKVTELRAIDLFAEGTRNELVAQNDVRMGSNSNGAWFINVAKKGTYRFELRRWPKEADVAIRGTVPGVKSEDNDIQLAVWGSKGKGRALDIQRARLSVNGYDVSKPVTENDKAITFDLELEKGDANVRAWFYNEKAQEHCVYYVDVYPID